MKKAIREVTYYCGKENRPEYLEIDLFPFFNDDKRLKVRNRKEKMTTPKQKALNDKMAKRYFSLLLKSNFREGDYHVTLSYSPKNNPESIEDAETELRNYIRRINHLRKKLGLKPVKYIYVTEKGKKSGRIHHHLIVDKGLTREQLEELWSRQKKAGQNTREMIGTVNADQLRFFDKRGIDALTAYLTKDPQGRRRWKQSKNLTKPQISRADAKTSRKRFEQLCLWPEDCEYTKSHFEKEHPGYELTELIKELNDETGNWHLTARMKLKKVMQNHEKTKRQKRKTKGDEHLSSGQSEKATLQSLF